MADEKENGKEGELELDNSGKNKKMIIIIIAVVVLLVGAAAGYFFMSGSDASQADITAALDSEGSEAKVVEASSSAHLGTALYVPMPRAFRFNVPGAARDRFVEIRVQLLVRGGDNEENAKMHIPLIESTLLSVFSQANADDLATSAGKIALKQQSLAAVQKIMTDVEGDKTVEKVLFTGFVMQ
ncbi:flagellar basal body-associated protein FliL [Colwellia sp. MT41]|uniref:Flagellar protein FliL n=1 Tax=Colwellia marinimaniae TaxID=1513592 RepID=A0ABQ0MVB0_9GAMM|nr:MULTISPECIES: flagellar basal body-associated protein FliL [Colwellia]ALO34286.1 flagellar basal body-associated protein FliL [Colwellia sp. MT41]GAW96300.1 flagellar basal body-associated protein FliL [Colwellia marinimaniae]